MLFTDIGTWASVPRTVTVQHKFLEKCYSDCLAELTTVIALNTWMASNWDRNMVYAGNSASFQLRMLEKTFHYPTLTRFKLLLSA